MRDWHWWILASIHLLAGAAWFGAMFYSLTVLHPRAGRFSADDEKFESFIATLAQGARWKVLSALVVIAITGVAMIPLAQLRPAAYWKWFIAAKAILWLLAVVIFCRVSWRLWPARIFAAAMVLGVWAHGG